MEVSNNQCPNTSLPSEPSELPLPAKPSRVHVGANEMIKVVIKSKKSDASSYSLTPTQPPSPRLPGESSIFPDIRLPDVKIDLSSYLSQSRQIELLRTGASKNAHGSENSHDTQESRSPPKTLTQVRLKKPNHQSPISVGHKS